ncbi:MAG TPA: alpha/beta fold hydrolase [Aquamicrobium sp.]|nr:alpha/beta fold hydrolase [Aquamicrobium sp.]
MALFVKEWGVGEGIPVVLLHGFGASHAVWAGIAERLGRETAVLAYDLPGHGGSYDFPDAGPPKVAASAILADLAARGIDRAHLVGHSMGGAVAALMALIEPQRVASLTLLAPGGFGPEINQRLLIRYAAAADEAVLEACLEAMFGWFSAVPEGLAGGLITERAAPGRREKLQAMAAGLARDGRQGMLPRDRLAALSIPATVAWGGLDNVLPARHAQDLPAGFELRLFPDLGHMLPEEAPDETLDLIRRSAGLAR